MLVATLYANWKPRKGYIPSKIEVETRKVSIGSRIWNNPNLKLEEIDIPKISSREVLIKVKACGICGSDAHMYEKDNEGYMLYPGLVKLPVVIGHELSGEVVKVG
ncbi:MAG: alcohol dehydrogenase catalytic domain-containing protein, partial [Nitrososphaeria archaeon]